MTPRLSREEVRAKYSPVPDPLWTPEAEAEFFAGLPAPNYRHTTKLDDEKAMLIRDYATVTLKAKRLSVGYLSTLGAILGEFAVANASGIDCLITQRGGHGSERTIRTIQAQMLEAGLVVRMIRPQGHGFVGAVFVYSPTPCRHRHRHPIGTEKYHRMHEGQSPGRHAIPANLPPEDVPY